jgi:hypothetical protein
MYKYDEESGIEQDNIEPPRGSEMIIVYAFMAFGGAIAGFLCGYFLRG